MRWYTFPATLKHEPGRSDANDSRLTHHHVTDDSWLTISFLPRQNPQACQSLEYVCWNYWHGESEVLLHAMMPLHP